MHSDVDDKTCVESLPTLALPTWPQVRDCRLTSYRYACDMLLFISDDAPTIGHRIVACLHPSGSLLGLAPFFVL